MRSRWPWPLFLAASVQETLKPYRRLVSPCFGQGDGDAMHSLDSMFKHWGVSFLEQICAHLNLFLGVIPK